MKKRAMCSVIVVITSVLFGYTSWSGEYLTPVPTTLVTVLGAPGRDATAFATNTVYVVGARVKANGVVYIAMNAGTSGQTVPYGVAADISDGVVLWRPTLRESRKGLIVQNPSDAEVRVSLFGTTNTMTMASKAGLIFLESSLCPQAPVQVFSPAGTNSVYASEW